LFVSGRKEAIWTSYHPSLPPIDLTIIRDEEMILDIDTRIKEAKQEITEEIEQIREL